MYVLLLLNARYISQEGIFRLNFGLCNNFLHFAVLRYARRQINLQIRILAGYFKKMLNDKNAAAMEKGLEPIFAFYDRYDHAPKYEIIENQD